MMMRPSVAGILDRFVCLSLSGRAQQVVAVVQPRRQGFKSASSSSGTGSASVTGNENETPPKKPKSAFLLFTADELPLLRSSRPDLKLVEMTKLLGERWSNEVPEARKQEYKDAYAKGMADYKERMERFEGKDGLMEELSRRRVEKALKKASRKQKALMLDLGKPRRPPLSPYAVFVKEKFEDARQKSGSGGKVEIGNVMKAVSDMWAGLADGDKAEFVKKHEALSAEYGRALADWEAKMSEDGKADDISKMGEKVKRIRRQKRSFSHQNQQQS